MREILVHYHIFKNAGSSIDEILRDGFGERWLAWDPYIAPSVFSGNALASAIEEHPNVLAISSHTLRPPFPRIEGVNVHPLFFVRHPILRAVSVYRHERSLHETNTSQRVASRASFAQWVRWMISEDPDTATVPLRNFQTLFLSGEELRASSPAYVYDERDAFARAVALLKSVPAFGIVERFAESVGRFEKAFQAPFPSLRWRAAVHANRSGAPTQTLDSVRSGLGEDLYNQLEASSAIDLELYGLATSLFDERQHSEHYAATDGMIGGNDRPGIAESTHRPLI